jgi:hypothetical protein
MRCVFLGVLIALAAGATSPPSITSPATLPGGTQYESYSTTLTATGGTGSYTWSVTTDTPMTLPEGTTLNPSTGAITGTPSGSGYYIVNFQVTDSASATAQAQITIPISGNQHLGSCTFFPADNVWRQRIDGLPVHAQSAVWNSTYHNATLHPDFGTQYGIPFTLVGAGQAPTTVTIDPVNGYPDESDFGVNTSGPAAVPIPADAPIEGTDVSSDDRHVLTIDTSACMLYELYYALLPAWTADSSALFNLNGNALRPDGYTSADAAGLPIVPGLVGYDEVASGEITHALRMTMQHTYNSYLWPGRHRAGTQRDAEAADGCPPPSPEQRLGERAHSTALSHRPGDRQGAAAVWGLHCGQRQLRFHHRHPGRAMERR